MSFPPPAPTSRLFRIRFLFCEWHLSKQKVVCFLVFAAFAAEGERGRGGDVIRMFLLLFHFLFLPPAALCMSQKGFFLLKGCQTQCRRRRQKTNPPSARLPHFSPFSFRSHPSPAVPWIPLSPRISVPLKQWKRGGCIGRKGMAMANAAFLTSLAVPTVPHTSLHLQTTFRNACCSKRSC